MGLDMYISKRQKNNDEYEFAYFRKANWIHNWFVDNIQEGNDDCKEYIILKNKAKELLDICNQIIFAKEAKNKDEFIKYCNGILPIKEGFFFGQESIEEDIDYYVESIIYLKNKLVEMIYEINNNKEVEFYYCSSW